MVLCALTLCPSCVRRGRLVEHESLAEKVLGQTPSFAFAFLRLVFVFESKHLCTALLQSRASSFECRVAPAAFVRLVTGRCRNRRHACVRSSRGAADVTNTKRVALRTADRFFFGGRVGRSAPSCEVKLLVMACTCVICDTLVRRLVPARGPHALQCVRLFREVRWKKLCTH